MSFFMKFFKNKSDKKKQIKKNKEKIAKRPYQPRPWERDDSYKRIESAWLLSFNWIQFYSD